MRASPIAPQLLPDETQERAPGRLDARQVARARRRHQRRRRRRRGTIVRRPDPPARRPTATTAGAASGGVAAGSRREPATAPAAARRSRDHPHRLQLLGVGAASCVTRSSPERGSTCPSGTPPAAASACISGWLVARSGARSVRDALSATVGSDGAGADDRGSGSRHDDRSLRGVHAPPQAGDPEARPQRRRDRDVLERRRHHRAPPHQRPGDDRRHAEARAGETPGSDRRSRAAAT